MNKVIIIGRLTSDPKMRGDTVANYKVAVDRKFKKEGQPTADFINCVAFGRQAEFAHDYLQKGMKIGVCGRIQTGPYTAQDGTKRYTTDVVAEEHYFVESKAQESAQSEPEQHDEFAEAVQEELPFD